MSSTTADTAPARTKPKILASWVVIAIALGATYIVANRVFDATRKVLSAQIVAPTDAALEAHCAAHIALAKEFFGETWKARLDPGDTICAKQIQAAWEHQNTARAIPGIDQPISAGIDVPPSPGGGEEMSPTDSRTRNPDTYCLNVVSLARTKYGDDWRARIDPGEAAACGIAPPDKPQ